MATSEPKSPCHYKYCTTYTDSLRILKDNILQDGKLSGPELQRCLLINGVPVQDCPTPDQLLQRLGLSHLAQSNTPTNLTGTLGRIKKRSSFRMKGHKQRSPTDTTEFLIMQLMHSCLQLLSLEATKQTPAHAPLSPNTGENKEESTRVDKKDGDEKSKDDDQDISKQSSIWYDNIDLEFCYVKGEKKLPLEGVDNTSEPLKDYIPLVTEETDRELMLLKHENQLLQCKLNKSELYTEHLEAKCDYLYVKLGNSQSQISKLINKQSDCESIPGMG